MREKYTSDNSVTHDLAEEGLERATLADDHGPVQQLGRDLEEEATDRGRSNERPIIAVAEDEREDLWREGDASRDGRRDGREPGQLELLERGPNGSERCERSVGRKGLDV